MPPGEGSTFTVQFQVTETTQADTEDNIIASSSAEVDLSGLTTTRPHLLVAEDNPVNQLLIGAQLETLGYSADFVENGIEALKLWKTGSYQLLLTDIRMPEMDGYELSGEIRALESNTTPIPIIAVTANAMASDVKQCLEAGANDVISKPFTLEALKQILEKWSPR